MNRGVTASLALVLITVYGQACWGHAEGLAAFGMISLVLAIVWLWMPQSSEADGGQAP